MNLNKFFTSIPGVLAWMWCLKMCWVLLSKLNNIIDIHNANDFNIEKIKRLNLVKMYGNCVIMLLISINI